MSEQVFASLLAIAGVVVSFILGRWSERNRQTLLIRAEMLKPIEEWLDGAEKIIQMVSDTLVTVSANSPLPLSYGLDERFKAAQFMSEKTNRVLGILKSNSLKTRQTAQLANRLTNSIVSLDNQVKYALLPLDKEILDRSASGALTRDFIISAASLKLTLESQVQEAHALIAQIKTALT